jgi:hypothetical protein
LNGSRWIWQIPDQSCVFSELFSKSFFWCFQGIYNCVTVSFSYSFILLAHRVTRVVFAVHPI